MLPWVMAILMLAARSARRVAAPGAARHASARLGMGDVIGPRAARPLLRRARWVPDVPGTQSRFAFGGGGSSHGGAHGGGEAAPSGGSQGAWASNGRDGGRFNLLEAVRHAVVLSDVISESGVEVERRGQAMYARCPFHGDGNERSPSLSINDALGKFRCFGCDERGDVLNYVMLKEGLSFREALAALATRYQIQRHSGQAASPRLSERRAAPPRPVSLTPEARARQLAVMEAATNHYEAALRERSAQACADMLRRRGVRSPTAALFRLGFAPASPSDHLTRSLLSGGFTAEEIVDAGLALRRSSDGSMFDRFGGRLVIPILNAGGHVVGFGARRVDGGSGEPREEGVVGEGGGKREAPKYINTKESAVFRKGEILYALPMASSAARKMDCIIVVEGYMDAISLHAAGFTNTVACLGTALSEGQIEEAASQSQSRRVILALDADEAGSSVIRRLAQRGVLQRLESKSVDVSVARLPAGFKDPDDLIRALGPPAFARALALAEDWVIFLGREAISAYLDKRKAAAAEAAEGGASGDASRPAEAAAEAIGAAAAGGHGASARVGPPPSVSRAFGSAVSELSLLLSSLPDGVRKLRHARDFALTLADGDRAMAERLELLLERPPAAQAARGGGGTTHVGPPAAPARAGFSPQLPSSVPADTPVTSFFVWSEPGGGGLPSHDPAGGGTVLHWDTSTCGASRTRAPTLGELGSLPPCPICSTASLQAAAAAAYAERVSPPVDFAELRSERAVAEVLALHALLQEPSLRLARPDAPTPFGVEWSTPGRRWLAVQLASPSRPAEQPADAVWSELLALDPLVFSALPELRQLREPPQALVLAAVRWAGGGRADGASAGAAASAGSAAPAVEPGPGGVPGGVRGRAAAALLSRCRAIIEIDERSAQLRGRARRLEWMGARAALQLHPSRGQPPAGGESVSAEAEGALARPSGHDGAVLGFFAEDCVRMSAALAADAAAIAKAAKALPPLPPEEGA